MTDRNSHTSIHICWKGSLIPPQSSNISYHLDPCQGWFLCQLSGFEEHWSRSQSSILTVAPAICSHQFGWSMFGLSHESPAVLFSTEHRTIMRLSCPTELHKRTRIAKPIKRLWQKSSLCSGLYLSERLCSIPCIKRRVLVFMLLFVLHVFQGNKKVPYIGCKLTLLAGILTKSFFALIPHSL